MLRLAHRILDQARSLEWSAKYCKQEDASNFLRYFTEEECCKIIADNVLEYALSITENGTQSATLRREFVANLAPPFKNFFVESQSKSGVTLCLQYGWLCSVLSDVADIRGMLKEVPEWKNTEWKWILLLHHVVTLTNGRCALTGDTCIVFIRQDGVLASFHIEPGEICADFGVTCDNITQRIHQQRAVQSVFGIPLMTINFMNCRNVTLENVTEKEGPPEKWLRRRKQPGLTYRTVTIDPNKPKRGHSKGGGGIPTEKRSFHICRGHFVNYTEANGSRGMFGQGIYGTFWVPSHTRGDKEHGQTITTYNVKAPK